MKLRVFLVGVAILLVLAGLPISVQAQTVGLHMQGVTVVDEAGKRFVFAGINMELFRDYAHGCGWVTDGQYAIRDVVSNNLSTLGVNTVRLNYTHRYLAQGDNLTKFLDVAEELTKHGMYIMPSDHTYSGKTLYTAAISYPMMQKIIEGMRTRGLEVYLIMNPFNEPGPTVTTTAWIEAQQEVLTFLRSTAKFDGVVALDSSRWATTLDVETFKTVMNFDAKLRNGTPNVLFSNHLYPNIKDLPDKLWKAANQVPLMVGELGQINPGASPLDPTYVKNVIAKSLDTGIPNGHNGLFAWLYAWCDGNKMLEDWEDPGKPYTESSTLTQHGEIWRDDYYAKLPTEIAKPVEATTPETTVTATPTS